MQFSSRTDQRDKHPLADLNWIVDRSYISRNSAESKLRELSEYIWLHTGTRNFERTLLNQIHRGIGEAADNIRRLTDVRKWDVSALLDGNNGSATVKLRKPKITLNYEYTGKGNLRLRWGEKYGEKSDFLFDCWDRERRFSEPELTELIFFRGFNTLLASTHEVGHEKSTFWAYHFRNALLDVALSYFHEQITYLKSVFDVEILNRIVTAEDDRDRIVSWEEVNAWEYARRKKAAAEAVAIEDEKRRVIAAEEYRLQQEEAERLRQVELRSAYDGTEAEYGIPAPRLASLLTMMSDARSTMPETIRVLESQFGLKNAPSPEEFEKVGRKIKKTLRAIGIEEDAPFMSRAEARELRNKFGKTSQEVSKLQAKITSEQRARKAHFENLTGLKTEYLIGLYAAYRAIGVPADKIGRIARNHFGMKPFKLPRFVRVMEQAERLRVSQDITPDVVILTEKQKAFAQQPSKNR